MRRININQNQLTLPFGTSRARAISYDNRLRFFWALTSISILSLCVYIYAINAIARNVALQQDLEKQVAEVSSSLNSLEFAHIELKNKVTMELAQAYGFSEAKNPLYVSRIPVSLSFNTVDR